MKRFTTSIIWSTGLVLIGLTLSACSGGFVAQQQGPASNNNQNPLTFSALGTDFSKVSTPSPMTTPSPVPLPSRTNDTNDIAFTTNTPTACTEHTPGMDALAASIQANAAAGDQSTTIGELNGCQAGLIRFSAAAVDANGNVVHTAQVSNYNQAHLGMYCPSSQGKTIDMIVRFFEQEGLRGQGINATYICKAGTDPNACTPAAANFIGGIVYGSAGAGFSVSYIAGQNSNLNPEQIIAKILTPGGGTYADLGTCNSVVLKSPLVIETVYGRGITTLDPLATNTYFDLTGSGQRDRISCVVNGAFLALPDANGQINNIDQLFGNNTLGPDGQRASNGFEALGKWDTKSVEYGYGELTAADPVFNRLRLWEDTNCDGIAQPNEILPLSALNIHGIRWINATQELEVDPYGNQTQETNMVFQNGQILRVFDLWFKTWGIQ